jgi:hypothetical protein
MWWYLPFVGDGVDGAQSALVRERTNDPALRYIEIDRPAEGRLSDRWRIPGRLRRGYAGPQR